MGSAKEIIAARNRGIAARAAKLRRVNLTVNEDELILLYALAGRECAKCALTTTGGGLAGSHADHEATARSLLAKASDAVLKLQEMNER